MPTYTPLESIVLTSAAASVTFSNISQNYQDLVVVISAKSGTDSYVKIQYNGDTGSNYSFTKVYGTGSSAGSNRGSSQTYWQSFYTYSASQFNTVTLQLQNYSNSTTFKTGILRENDAAQEVNAQVGLWRSTAAITSVLFEKVSGTFTAGSTFDLYAVSPAAANTAQASGGTEIIYTNTHVIHVFKASGTFTPTRNLTADYLVVAGGGGGGSYTGSGGGGAGGLRSTVTASGGSPGTVESALSLTANTAYTVTVGAGGAGGITSTEAANGNNSVFSTITSTGGGAGGGYKVPFYAAKTGGSGGGGVYNTHTSGAAGTNNQGFSGGNGAPNYDAGGGGGGAGAVGGNGVGTLSGNAGTGGTGVAVAITGSSVTYAGGGGGGKYRAGGTGNAGAGGAGGGGAGNTSDDTGSAASGTTNTGGGGGATGTTTVPVSPAGGNGGSGIVIVRYAR